MNKDKIFAVINYVFYKIILAACGIFTVLAVVSLWAVSGDDTTGAVSSLTWEHMWFFFGFALCFAACGAIFRAKGKIGKYIAVLLHLILTLLVIVVFMIFIGERYIKFRRESSMVIIFVYAVFYAAIAAIWAVVNYTRDLKKREEKEYKSRFKK